MKWDHDSLGVYLMAETKEEEDLLKRIFQLLPETSESGWGKNQKKTEMKMVIF